MAVGEGVQQLAIRRGQDRNCSAILLIISPRGVDHIPDFSGGMGLWGKRYSGSFP